MAKFKKSILKVGTYHSGDGSIEVTPQRLRHWADTFKRFSAAGNVAPASFDHNDKRLEPLSEDEFRTAKDTVGRLAGLEVSQDGQSAEMTLSFSDDKASDLAESNDVFVSPVLASSWRDGAGNSYDDIWTHVDIVNHPVDNTQTPFIALSSGQQIKPKTWRFSVSEETNVKEPEGDTTPTPEQKPAADPVIPDPAKVSPIPEIIVDLAKLGVLLGEDTDEANFIERLLPALKTFTAQKAMSEATPAEPEGDPLVVESQEFQQMSLRANSALAFAEKAHRTQLVSRLDDLFASGRCTPGDFSKRKVAITTVKLSLDSEGNAKASAFEEWLTDRETIPKGTFWDPATKIQKMSLTAEPAPASLVPSEMTDEKAGELANKILKKA